MSNRECPMSKERKDKDREKTASRRHQRHEEIRIVFFVPLGLGGRVEMSV